MEIKEIKTTGLKREFEIRITNKSIDQLVQNKISELAPKASIPGFRTGKVPHNIIKMRFGKQIFGEVVNESLNNASKKLLMISKSMLQLNQRWMSSHLMKGRILK